MKIAKDIIRIAVLGVMGAGLLIESGCSTFSSAEKERTAQAHYKLGISHLNNNQIQQAFVEFHKAVEANPKDRDARYALGHVYFIQGRLPEAEREIKAALKQDKEFSDAHNHLGTIHAQKGEWDLAIQDYQKALANPQYSTPHFAHYNLGLAFMNTNKYENALKAFQDALKIEPSYSAAYHRKGEVYYLLDRFQESIESFKQGLRLTPDDPDMHFQLGQSYFKQGLRQEAREEFEKAMKLAPEGELAKNSKQYLELLR